jgi:hypothetical protein
VVEQGTHKPLVGGSNPPSATKSTPLNTIRAPRSMATYPISGHPATDSRRAPGRTLVLSPLPSASGDMPACRHGYDGGPPTPS